MRGFSRTLMMLGMVFALPSAWAQPLEARVAAAPAGAVRMTYPAREGVCGKGQHMRASGSRSTDDWIAVCEPGPVRVQLEKEDGGITRVRTYVGGRWLERSDVTDLGDVAAVEASEFLLNLASTAPGAAAAQAITAAVIADAPDPWQRLLELARDGTLDRRTRTSSIFWVGQSAATQATRGLSEIVDSDDEATSVRTAAVFALSRRDDPERIEQLTRIARTHANPAVVRAAFFWLAQSEDARAVDLFEEILSAETARD